MKRNILIISLVLLAVSLLGCEEVAVDVKPQSCPNPLNVKSKGVLPIAILGTDELDVCDINITTVGLYFTEVLVVEAIADKVDYNDVSTPYDKGSFPDCNCSEDGPDGYEDVVFYFDTQEVVAALETAVSSENGSLEDGQEWPLAIVGDLWADVEEDYDIAGYDCVVIRKKGKNQ